MNSNIAEQICDAEELGSMEVRIHSALTALGDRESATDQGRWCLDWVRKDEKHFIGREVFQSSAGNG